jgi:ribosome-associated protein
LDILDQIKGEDIVILYLGEVCSFTDYFVICTGASERTLNALADAVKTKIKKTQELRAMKIEGDAQSGWMILDYGDVILHVFTRSMREYYRLEELWSEGQILVHLQ